MGKSVAGPRAGVSIGAPVLLCAGLAVAGCAHRDVVDTPVGWWHQLQGGEIAKQRPPPPGLNDPYPRVGTTPARAPAVASLDLRRSVTSNLLRQRNLTTRLDANSPLPPEVVVHTRPALPKPASAPAPGGSSASLDAAEGPARPAASIAASTDAAPEMALPAVQVEAPATGGVAMTLPAIPGAPPPPPRLPGVDLPAGLPASAAPPDYPVAPIGGTAIAFTGATDSMLSGQRGALHALAAQRGTGTILVRGFGDCASPDAQSQAQALTLASLRARSVGHALLAEGVPGKSILLRADAFGRGASVSLVQ